MTVDINLKWEGKGAVLRQLDAIKSGIERTKVLRRIARMAVDLIKIRTLSGYDENDRPLIPSKRAQRDSGQTLSDRGHMLGSMGQPPSWHVESVNPDRAVIGFGSNAMEAKKAWWAQKGTRPHTIFARPGGVLAFASSLSTATHIVNTRGGVKKARRLTMSNALANGKGMSILQHVHHPGTPPRPFFGISPKDGRELESELNFILASVIDTAQATR